MEINPMKEFIRIICLLMICTTLIGNASCSGYSENEDSFIQKKVEIPTINTPTARKTLLFIGKEELHQNHHCESKALAMKLMQWSIDSRDLKNLANAYQLLGYNYMLENNNYQAFGYFSLDRSLKEERGDYAGLILSNINFAELYYYTGNFFSAETAALKAHKLAYRVKDKNGLYLSLSWLGITSSALHDYEGANKYQFRALEVLKDLDNEQRKFNEATCLHNIGDNFLQMKEYEKSLKHFRLAKKIAPRDRYPNLYFLISDKEAYAEFLVGGKDLEHVLAENYLQRDSLKIFQGQNYNRLYLSEIYARREREDKARSLAIEALNISKLFKSPPDILESLKHVCRTSNDVDSFEHLISLYDSLDLVERANANKFQKIKYESEVDAMELQQTLVEIKHMYIISGFGISAMTILLISTRRRHKQQEAFRRQVRKDDDQRIYQMLHDQYMSNELARQDAKISVSQELHDGIMNRLSSIRLNLFSGDCPTHPDSAAKTIAYIKKIEEVEQELLNLADDIGGSTFKDTTFILAVQKLLDEASEAYNMIIDLHIDQSTVWEQLDNVVKMNLYRILQESLQNTYKHSGATTVKTTLGMTVKSIYMTVSDNGCGFATRKKRTGIGIANIRRRAAEIGATLAVRSKIGFGTTIRVSVPNSML